MKSLAFASLVLLMAVALSCRTPSTTPAPEPASAAATQDAQAHPPEMHEAPVPRPAPNPQSAPSMAPDRPNPIIERLRQEIAGKENLPAEQVFQNIQIMQGLPAGRLLAIMDKGFTPALGVRCSYCHEPGDWASDAKDHKNIAREMWKMTGDLNTRIQGITGDESHVNCSTCHQGHPHPPGHGEHEEER